MGDSAKVLEKIVQLNKKRLKTEEFEEKKFIVRFSGRKASEEMWKIREVRKFFWNFLEN